MYTEDELLPISALQHFLFCRRQCALIHIEGLWTENYLTAQGRLLHEKTHNGETENRPGVRIVRGLRLCRQLRPRATVRTGNVSRRDVANASPAGCIVLRQTTTQRAGRVNRATKGSDTANSGTTARIVREQANTQSRVRQEVQKLLFIHRMYAKDNIGQKRYRALFSQGKRGSGN